MPYVVVGTTFTASEAQFIARDVFFYCVVTINKDFAR